MSDVNSILENANRLIFLEVSIRFDHNRESVRDLCNQYYDVSVTFHQKQ